MKPAQPFGAGGFEAKGGFDPRAFLQSGGVSSQPTVRALTVPVVAPSKPPSIAVLPRPSAFAFSAAPAAPPAAKPVSAVALNLGAKPVKLKDKKPVVSTSELQQMFRDLSVHPVHVKGASRPSPIVPDADAVDIAMATAPPPVPPSRVAAANKPRKLRAISEVTATPPTTTEMPPPKPDVPSAATPQPPPPSSPPPAVLQPVSQLATPLPPPSPVQTRRSPSPRPVQRAAATPSAKVDELQTRALHLERTGEFGPALALLRTALALRPNSPALASHVDRLQDLLREQVLAPSQLEQEKDGVADPLAALIDPLDALVSRRRLSESASSVVAHSPTPANSPTRSSPASSSSRAASDSLASCLERVAKLRATGEVADKACEAAERLLAALCQLDAMASNEQHVHAKVRFRGVDASACAPPPRLCSGDMDAALGPTDEAIAAYKATDQLGKAVATPSVRAAMERAMQSCGNSARLFWHVVDRAKTGRCACSSEGATAAASGCCELGAVAPRQRLGDLLNSALRFCMRGAFNGPSMGLQSNTGSYRHNDDDVAAVAHTALVLLETRMGVAEAIVLGLKRPSAAGNGGGDDDDGGADSIAQLAEFVEAHRFLTSLFPSAVAQTAMEDANREAWARMRRYVGIAREARCAGSRFEDEMLFGEWLKMADKLKALAKLAAAAATMVDGAERKTTEELCKCAGARRRRAALLGSWLAPTVARGALRKAGGGKTCRQCAQPVSEGGAAKLKCECCEEAFHAECLGLPANFAADFFCTKCSGFAKPALAAVDTAARTHDGDDDDDAAA